jgi:mono/diheme cytochrome c family protein
VLSGTVLPLAAITGLGKGVLIAVAGTFILFSLVCAITIPKRSPNFPRNLPAFLTIVAALFAAQMGAVVWVTGTQEVEESTAQEAQPPGGETAPTETTPATGDATAGKQVFTSAGCVSCHTLADAGATGSVGPNLDKAKPPAALVIDRVTHGKGIMPAFQGQLSDQQIKDVAAYVSSVAGA